MTTATFRFSHLADQPLRHAMSLRRPDLPSEGDVGYSRDTDQEHSRANRAVFLENAGIPTDALTLGRQVHGTSVALITSAERGRGRPPSFDAIPDTDGLLTREADVALAVVVADCVPLILYDPVRHAVGLVHAGWRGTVAGIAARAVERMTMAFGSNPADLHAGIGPSIGPCCYEVGDEVIGAWCGSAVAGWELAVLTGQPRSRFDLWTANALTLCQSGLVDENIEIAALCTRCEAEHFFSHRAAMAGERPRGRMIMAAQLEAITSQRSTD